MLSTLAVVGTAVGATAANFAVLSDHGSLHGNTEFGGIAPAAEAHLSDAPQPTPSMTSLASTDDGDDDANARQHKNHSGVPAPWVTHDDGDDAEYESQTPVAVPTTNKPVVTLTPHVTKTPKPQKTEDTHVEEDETEEPEYEDGDDD